MGVQVYLRKVELPYVVVIALELFLVLGIILYSSVSEIRVVKS